ncbi:MAG: hypothetical protein WCG45_03090 [bacterium]
MKNVKNVFFKDKFEELLIANWTQFLDHSKLLAFVLFKIQEEANNLTHIEVEEKPFKGIRITISRFSFAKNGFIFWVDFIAPFSSSQIVEGTMELFLDTSNILETENLNLHNESISCISMLGNIYHLKK